MVPDPISPIPRHRYRENKMALEKITQVSGRGVFVAGNDIDTDRIIPARFMKCVTFDGLGRYLFHDVRFDDDGRVSKNHPIDDPRFEGASILISNKNFGCGSSREHAPQALAKAGFKAVIAEGFAEIFFGNSTTLGMPCVVLSGADIKSLAEAVESDPSEPITIDLEGKELTKGELVFKFETKEAARHALIEGQWDPIAQLLEGKDAVNSVAGELPYVGGFAA